MEAQSVALMFCPACRQHVKIEVLRTMDYPGAKSVLRTRKCVCGFRGTTEEHWVAATGSTQAAHATATGSVPVGYPYATRRLPVGYGQATGSAPPLPVAPTPPSGGVGGALSSEIGSDLGSGSAQRGKRSNGGGKSAPNYSEDFKAFWSAYPNKTGKGAAWVAWQKDVHPIADVLAALAWQTKAEAWTKEGGAFVPHPATYLHQRRWEDEPKRGPAPRQRDFSASELPPGWMPR